MAEHVRVRLENGSEVTTTRTHAENSGLKILEDKPADSEHGKPLPEKHKTTVDDAAAKKTTAAKRTAAAEKTADTGKDA